MIQSKWRVLKKKSCLRTIGNRDWKKLFNKLSYNTYYNMKVIQQYFSGTCDKKGRWSHIFPQIIQFIKLGIRGVIAVTYFVVDLNHWCLLTVTHIWNFGTIGNSLFDFVYDEIELISVLNFLVVHISFPIVWKQLE